MLPPELRVEFTFQVYFVFKSDDSLVFHLSYLDEDLGCFSLLGWYSCPDRDLDGMFLDAVKNAN